MALRPGSDVLQEGEWEAEKLGAEFAKDWLKLEPGRAVEGASDSSPSCFSSLGLNSLICKMG